MSTRYYFDHNATTPVRPEVAEAMLPYLTELYGNPSSAHSFGREARLALEKSREKVAELIGADSDEVFFTGCGTESDNIALTGFIRSAPEGRRKIITSKVEHSAILKTGKMLEQSGYEIVYLDVDDLCRVDLDMLRDTVDDTTALVTIMHGNNETGVLQDIAEAARIAHEAGAAFHTDAVQSAGKVTINVDDMGIDMLSMSGHKLNAPKGIGVLYLRRGVTVTPLTYGGSHERGMRPGTENISSIVAFGKSAELSMAEMEEKQAYLGGLRDRLETAIEKSVPDTLFNGRGAARLAGTSNMSFPGVDGEALMFSLDRAGIAVSTGSACTTGDVQPSHVLVAMGIAPKTAQSSLRFSMGWGTSDEGIDHIIETLPPIVERLRSIAGGL